MITKAGVPANKIMVGMALYGRSFQMTQPGCYTEMCTFTGPHSGAIPGKCTDTAGYISNWEIQQILENPVNRAHKYFSTDAGDIVVYNDTQWVSYMSKETYNVRMKWIEELGFAGTSDWAIDLETSYHEDGSEEQTGSGLVYVDPELLTDPNSTISCQPPCTFVLPPWILSTKTTIIPTPITETVLNLYSSTQTINGVTTKVYVSIMTTTTITLPPIITDTISVSNVEWTDVSDTVIYFTSSVIPPPLILTQSDVIHTASSSSTTLAGISFTFRPGPYPTLNPEPPGPGTDVPLRLHLAFIHLFMSSAENQDRLALRAIQVADTNAPLPVGSSSHVQVSVTASATAYPGEGNCAGEDCGAPDDKPQESCSTTHTITDCEVQCSITDYGSSATTTCPTTTCVTIEACQATTGSTTTSKTTSFGCPWTTALTVSWVPNDPYGPPPVLGGGGDAGYTVVTGRTATPRPPAPTSFINCEYHQEDPDNGVYDRYCECSASIFAATTNSKDPANSCAYTALPKETISVSTASSVVPSNCQVCTFVGEAAQCRTEDGCTPTSTTTTSTSTSTSTQVATPVASCDIWDTLIAYTFEIYDIEHFATDGGKKIHHEENGCSALTQWSWHDADKDNWPKVTFSLPFFIKGGRVERVIHSAGGPKIKCKGRGVGYPGIEAGDHRRRGADVVEITEEQALEDEARSKASVSVTSPPPPPPPASLMPTYTYSTTFATRPHYTPMSWPPGEPPVTVMELVLVPVVVVQTVIPKPVNPLKTTLPTKTASA